MSATAPINLWVIFIGEPNPGPFRVQVLNSDVIYGLQCAIYEKIHPAIASKCGAHNLDIWKLKI